MITRLQRLLKSPVLLLVHLFKHKPFCYFLSDACWLKMMFFAYHHKKLDLTNPKSYNEKLQWLKLYDRKPEYRMMSDKFAVREYIAKEIGEEHLIPLLGVWNNVEDIDFNSLPNQFVLKCNHDSAGLLICKDKNKLDVEKAKQKLKRCLKRDYFWAGREDNYRVVNKKVIAEKYMTDGDKDELTDYKFFCFDGEPKFIQVDTGRFSRHIRNFYDISWNFIDVQNGCPNDKTHIISPPSKLEQMLEYSRKLARGLVHVRVDLYEMSNEIYFGELTFHHGGGEMDVTPESYDYEWGSYLHLPK